MSGLPTRRFAFEAFLPRDKKERAAILQELKDETRTIIIYEAPHHLVKTLEELYDTLGDRQISICRELTKRYEEKMRTTLSDSLVYYGENEPRGEYVLVIHGKTFEELAEEARKSWEDMSLEEHMQVYESQGIARKEAMKLVAKKTVGSVRGMCIRRCFRRRVKMKKIPMILLAMFTLSGCDRQEMIYSFNHVEEASVDNEIENTESVDNIQAETERAVDITTEEPEISDVYSGPTVTLAMVGDVLLHTPVEESCQAEDGSYDFSSLFANVKDEVQAADIAIVNQEVIIGGEELGVSGYPSFNAPYEVADALAETGFDVILHGTNHAMDQGKKELLIAFQTGRKNILI